MAAFVIADTSIENPREYEEYKLKARAIAESFGGRYRARGGETEVVDAELWTPTRMVVIEFPDMERARAFVHSAEYAPVAALRHAHARSTVVIVDGM